MIARLLALETRAKALIATAEQLALDAGDVMTQTRMVIETQRLANLLKLTRSLITIMEILPELTEVAIKRVEQRAAHLEKD